MKVINKMNIITLHHGKAAKMMSFEEEILDYVLYSRALGNDVVSNELIFKLWNMDETFREKSWSTLQKWWYRFMKIHFLTFRRKTHISQNFKEIFFK